MAHPARKGSADRSYIPKKVLLSTGEAFRYIQGANIFHLELAEYLLSQGCEVVLFSTLALPPMLSEAKRLDGADRLHIINDPNSEVDTDFDLIFMHDNTLPDSIIDALEDGLSTRIVPLHMSTFVHIERPLFYEIEDEIADVIACVSPAVRDSLVDSGLNQEKLTVVGNFVPERFAEVAKSPKADQLKSLLIVSNHLPPEAEDAASLLQDRGVRVTRFGEGGTVRRIQAEDILEHDAVLSIGKTVQYALTLGVVPYVYDRFGGPGYLNAANWEPEEGFTYSGRVTEEKRTAEQIADELTDKFSEATEFLAQEQTMFSDRYRISNRINELLHALPTNPTQKKISSQQARAWKNFCEIYRGLYRELEYFKDRTSELLVSPESQSSASSVTRHISLKRLTAKPLLPNTVAVVVGLKPETMERSLLSLRTQTVAPAELHLTGDPDSIAHARTALSEWATREKVTLGIVPDHAASSFAAAINHVAQNTECGIVAALDPHTSWLHTFIESSLSTFDGRPETAAAVHRSIIAFVDQDTHATQYYFSFGPDRRLHSDLLADDLLNLKAVPLSNMLIRTQQLLDAGGFDARLSDNGSHTLLLRLSRLGPILVVAGHEHSEAVHFRIAGTREAADLSQLTGEGSFHQRELLDTLLKSPDPRDNTYATLIDRRQAKAGSEDFVNLNHETNHRLDLLLQRIPTQGFEARMRMWAGQFPGRAKRALGRRIRTATHSTASGQTPPVTPRSLDSMQKARNLISNADIVSFDVFDTLLDRPVLRPSDAFALASEAVRREFGRWISPEWPEQRVAAELHCYGKPGIGPDITYEDIYAELKLRRIADDETLSLLQQAELGIELELLSATTRGKALFEEARRQGKTILIVSDMYLPKSLISDALTAAGYSGWEQLIVSGYDKLGKHSGTAFARLVQDYPGKIIAHFGDNLEADVLQPRHYGVTSSLLPRPRDVDPLLTGGTDVMQLREDSARKGFSALDLARSFSGGMTERRLDRNPNREPLADIGYSVLGPTLVGLSQWLDSAARRNGTEKLLFLAREGRLMMQAYQAFWGDSGLEAQYAYASRRMINLTQVTDHLTESALDFLTATGTPLSVADYVRRFIPTLPESTLLAALEGTRLEPSTVLGPERSAEIRAVFRRLEDEVIDVIQGERVNVLDYLRSIGADRPHAGVVDIGWQGSIQRSIEQALNPELLGYYFALHDVPSTRTRTSLNGFIDPRGDHAVSTWHLNQLMPGIEVIELLFANPEEASVSSVRKVGEGYAPVYSKEKLGPEEASRIRVLQAAALDFVRDFAQLDRRLSSGAPRLTPEASLAPLSALITNPTPAQAHTIGSFPHDNSLGIIATPLGLPLHSADYYQKNPQELQQELDAAWWKPGFIANARAAGIAI